MFNLQNNFIKTLTILLVAGLVGFALPTQTFSAFNKEINYQGKLSDSNGSTVADGDYNMTFRLYNASSSGTLIWDETRSASGGDGPAVSVSNGLFSVRLGRYDSLDSVDFNQDLWLSLEVEGDGEMTPRKKLTTVPSAFEAQNAETVGGVASSSLLRSDQSDTQEATSSDTLLSVLQNGAGNVFKAVGSAVGLTVDSEGDVGVGTSSPSTQLEVVGTSTFNGDAISSFTGNNLSVTNGVLDASSDDSVEGSELDNLFSQNGFLERTGTNTYQATSTIDISDDTNLSASGGASLNDDDISVDDVDTLSTGLSSGSVVFSDGSSLTEDNANFFWDDTNNRLGIGTSSPDSSLSVQANTGQSAPLARFTNSSGTTPLDITTDARIDLGEPVSDFHGFWEGVASIYEGTSYTSPSEIPNDSQYDSYPAHSSIASGLKMDFSEDLSSQGYFYNNHSAINVNGSDGSNGFIDVSDSNYVANYNRSLFTNTQNFRGWGFGGTATLEGADGQANLLQGGWGTAVVNDNASADEAVGLEASLEINNGGSVDNFKALNIFTTLDGTESITNGYGIYQENSDLQNYFQGDIGIGTTSPAETLSVSGNILGTGNLQIGGDTINNFSGSGLTVNSNNLEVDDIDSINTSLATGSVAFSDGSSLTEDNANFFWDNANNRLGIGTSSPSQPLDIAQRADSQGIQLTGYDDQSGESAAIDINSSGALDIDASKKLVLSGDKRGVATDESLLIGDANTDADAGLEIDAGDISGDIFAISSGANNTASTPTGDLAIMNSDGDFGLGTSSPSSQFEVVGTSTFNGDAISDFTGNNLTVGSDGVLDASGGGGSPGGSDGQIQYNNGGSFGGLSGFVLDDTNNRLGVGTSSPVSALAVSGTTTADAVSVNGDTISDFTGSNLSVSGGTLDASANDSVSGSELDNLFSQNGFLERTSSNSYQATSTIDISDDTNLTASAGASLSDDDISVDDVDTLNTSLSSGSVAFSDGSTLSEDNSNLYWDNSNNRLGIGTSSPISPLTVVGTTTVETVNAPINKSLTIAESDPNIGELDSSGVPKKLTINSRDVSSANTNTSGGDTVFVASRGRGSGDTGSFTFQTGQSGVSIDSDNITTGNIGDSNTLSHTVKSKSDQILIVSTAAYSNDVSGVTYSGQSLTQLEEVPPPTSFSPRVQLWYLTDPPSGTANISISNGSSVTVGARNYSGVDLNDPFGTTATASGDSSNPSVSVSSADGDLVIGTLGTWDDYDWQSGSGQTNRYLEKVYRDTLLGDDETGSSTVTLSYTNPNSNSSAYGLIGVSLKAVSGSTKTSLADALRIKPSGNIVAPSGNIGIGSAQPSIELAVGDRNTGLNSPASGELAVTTNGTEEVRVGSNGNVGIGTNSPGDKLVIEDTVDAGLRFHSTETYVFTDSEEIVGELIFEQSESSDDGVGAKIQGKVNSEGDTDLVFQTGKPSTLSETMRIDSSGNVGIGTSTPGADLHVQEGDTDSTIFSTATGVFEDTGKNYVHIIGGSSNTASLTFGDDGDAGVGRIEYDNSNDDMELWTNGSERMTVDSSGNVGIGTTSPVSALAVSGTTTADVISVNNDEISDFTGNNLSVGSDGVLDASGGGGSPGGSDGQIQYNNGGSFGGLSGFVLDDANSRLGVGTSSPTEALSVSGNIFGTGNLQIGGNTIGDFTGSGLSVNSNTLDVDDVDTLSTGLASGSVVFSDGSSLTEDNANFFWDNANNRLGIGTSSPSATLEVGAMGSTPRFRVGSATSGTYAFEVDETDEVSVGTGDGDIFLDTSGSTNVGVGTSSPVTDFTVVGDALFAGANRYINFDSGTGSGGYGIRDNSGNLEFKDSGGSWTNFGSGGSGSPGGSDGQVQFNSSGSFAGSSEFFWDNASSSLGIGTSSPNGRLSIDHDGSDVEAVEIDARDSSLDSKPAFVVETPSSGSQKAFQLATDGDSGAWASFSRNDSLAPSQNPGFFLGDGSGSQDVGLYRGGADQLSLVGDIGIGTANPSAQLSIDSGSQAPTLGLNGPTQSDEEMYVANEGNSSDTVIGLENSSNFFELHAQDDNKFRITDETESASWFTIDGANDNVGIGTTSPSSQFEVVGTSTFNGDAISSFTGNNLTVGSDGVLDASGGSGSPGGSDGQVQFNSSGSFAGSSEFFWDDTNNRLGIGTSSPDTKFHVYDATSSNATSTFDTNVEFDGGAFSYDAASNETNVDNLALGATNFESDAGVVSWVDMPVTASSSAGTEESYTAQIDGNPLLTVFSESNGSGGIQNEAVGIATSSPSGSISENLVVAGSGVAGQGSYNNLSSQRSIKQNFEDKRVLSNISDLDLLEWEYTTSTAEEIEDDSRHLYPFAGDFYNTFGLGNGTSSINAFDIAGVALRGVQEREEIIDIDAAPTGTPPVAINASSSVGIGTTSPNYDLQVDGDVAAESFVNVSTENAKKNISSLNASERSRLVDRMMGINLKQYNYKGENKASSSRLGLIAEQAPADILADSGKGVDIYQMASANLAGLQETNKEVEKLRSKVDKLSNQDYFDATTTTVGTSTGVSEADVITTVRDWLNDQATTIKDGVVAATDGFFGTVTTEQLVIDTSTATSSDSGDASKDSAAGSGKIAESATTTTIFNDRVATTSQVVVTFTGRHDGSHWVDKNQDEFSVNMSKPQEATTTFDYLVIGVKDATAKEVMAGSSTPQTAGTSTLEEGTESSSSPDLGPMIDKDSYGTDPSDQEDDDTTRPETKSDDDTSTSTDTSDSDTATTTDSETSDDGDTDTASSTDADTDTDTDTSTTTATTTSAKDTDSTEDDDTQQAASSTDSTASSTDETNDDTTSTTTASTTDAS